MTKKQAMGFYGSGIRLAAALGITPQAVYGWKNGIPFARQEQLHKLTRGKLKKTSPEKYEEKQ